MNITPIKLDLPGKLRDKEYRDAFFNATAIDEVTMQLIDWRKVRGFTQQQLAAATGMHTSAIARMESLDYGAWTFKSLLRIANALDLKMTVTFKAIESIADKYQDLDTPPKDGGE